MRLTVRQADKTVNEFRFTKGPIYIGRHANSQVFLAESAVSRQHAVLFTTDDGKWVVEDLDSANKTYLNDEAVHKSEIKTGDSLRIGSFTIEVSFDDDTAAGQAIHLEDTLTLSKGPQVIVREIDSEQAPPIRLPAGRAKDFLQATEVISSAGNIDQLLLEILNITQQQFRSYNVWSALRNQPDGPMICHGGRRRDGSAVSLDDIKLSDKINQSVEKKQFLLFLFSRTPNQSEKGQLRSAVIAPVIGSTGCFGVTYVDNAMGDEHYSLSDLDYLMLLGIHTSVALKGM